MKNVNLTKNEACVIYYLGQFMDINAHDNYPNNRRFKKLDYDIVHKCSKR